MSRWRRQQRKRARQGRELAALRKAFKSRSWRGYLDCWFEGPVMFEQFRRHANLERCRGIVEP